MHAKVEGPFSPSIIAREEVCRILSTGSIEFCGGEAVQMMHYLDALTPSDPFPSGEAKRGLWQRLAVLFQLRLSRDGVLRA
ncbi:MAG: hypothetical protein E5V49_16450 [Mesorhizobium sp.]|nr:hypothetical protein EN848_22095 [bacterium M00.F.Ca.ET.205.01.1.1]TGU50952.1 hypothetical protein EN795_21640 [bacterium M00.F.Ca.ET.152.01.1.1]TGZ41889.1 hypothetical protein EN805_16455 [bacterium M00.F.Ca.ET.162.01.1.1]TJW31466.1 MAG: hypothetical protein E5V49_16450 [Mesorhizobium sp.]